MTGKINLQDRLAVDRAIRKFYVCVIQLSRFWKEFCAAKRF